LFKKVLLCYDGTVEGRRALRQGADLASAMQSKVYLLAICRSLIAASVPEGVTPELIASEENAARALLNEGVSRLKELGLNAEGFLVYGNPMVLIPDAAARIGADLIVVGYKTRGRFARWWSESNEQMLVSRVNCSILVTRAPPPPPPQ
jgi:nucleotide-binding universal stress UspA family protein